MWYKGWLVPDIRLQTIADAWDSYIWSDGHSAAYKNVVDWWPELATAIDAAFTEEGE